jgi:lysophospholipase L1-like esterase
MKKIVLSCAALLWAGGVAQAQLVDEFNPPQSACCLVGNARTLANQLEDWNMLGRFHAANEALKKEPAVAGRVVFMGDSITDFWRLEDYFPGKPYVNRGIGGQTTPQMLVRMYPDVIELKPAAMVVLAGTNDISHNTGPSTAEMVQQNIMAMTELAQHHGIKTILCSILPVSDYPFQAQQAQPAQAGRGGAGAPGAAGPGRGMMRAMRQTPGRPPEQIVKLNAWMKDYAAKVGAIYCDYFSAVTDQKGWLKEGISTDGLHPNADGYKIMAPLAQAAIEQALRR